MLRFVFGWQHEGRFVFDTLQTDISPTQPAAAGQCHYRRFTEEEIMLLYIHVAVVWNLLNSLSHLLFTGQRGLLIRHFLSLDERSPRQVTW